MMKTYFSNKELLKIKNNTHRNYHMGNYLFIANRIKSKKILLGLKRLNTLYKRKGYLDSNMWNKQYLLYKKLMVDLRKKSPKDYAQVYRRL